VKTPLWPLGTCHLCSTRLPTFRSNLPQRECPRSADSQPTKWKAKQPLPRTTNRDIVLSPVYPLSILKTYLATTWTRTDYAVISYSSNTANTKIILDTIVGHIPASWPIFLHPVFQFLNGLHCRRLRSRFPTKTHSVLVFPPTLQYQSIIISLLPPCYLTFLLIFLLLRPNIFPRSMFSNGCNLYSFILIMFHNHSWTNR